MSRRFEPVLESNSDLTSHRTQTKEDSLIMLNIGCPGKACYSSSPSLPMTYSLYTRNLEPRHEDYDGNHFGITRLRFEALVSCNTRYLPGGGFSHSREKRSVVCRVWRNWVNLPETGTKLSVSPCEPADRFHPVLKLAISGGSRLLLFFPLFGPFLSFSPTGASNPCRSPVNPGGGTSPTDFIRRPNITRGRT